MLSNIKIIIDVAKLLLYWLEWNSLANDLFITIYDTIYVNVSKQE